MCEVNKHNFEEHFPGIIQRINDSAFVAIDCEFTGLRIKGMKKPSLFDTASERYKILQKSSSNFIICQLGLCAFVPESGKNCYEAFAYNFYICPSSHYFKDSQFSMQVSCIEFLCAQKFDFNKFFYKGIPYLNEKEENELKSRIESENVLKDIDDNALEAQILKLYSEVTSWLQMADEGCKFELKLDDLLQPYFIHKNLRRVFSNVWTSEDNGNFIIEKVNPYIRKERELKDVSLNKRFLNSELGFSRIFKHLVQRQKPLIGHNLFLDLLLIYNNFYRPLPATLDEFKAEIHKLFPTIYDTRHIGHELRKHLVNKKINEAFSLQELFEKLHCRDGRFAVLYSPTITLAPGFEYYESEHPHEAGYDAYIAGYVFLRLSHFYFNFNLSSYAMRVLSPAEHLSSVKSFCNRVNLIRAHINFINLVGSDPETLRPQWLFMQSKSPLNLIEALNEISRYGTVDLRQKNDFQALIAVTNHRCAQNIIRAFRGHPDYRISKYNVICHSFAVRSVLWLSIPLLGGLGVALIFCATRR